MNGCFLADRVIKKLPLVGHFLKSRISSWMTTRMKIQDSPTYNTSLQFSFQASSAERKEQRSVQSKDLLVEKIPCKRVGPCHLLLMERRAQRREAFPPKSTISGHCHTPHLEVAPMGLVDHLVQDSGHW